MKIKHFTLYLSLLFPIISFSSCNKLPNKINTIYGINNTLNRKMKEIGRNDITSFMAKDIQKTFILVQTTKNCHCSATFETIVNNYIKDTGLLIYSIDYDEIKDTNYGFALRQDSPTFHVILKGKNLNNLEKFDDKNFISNQEYFNSYMNNHISKPSIFIVDETELEQLFNNDSNFAMYYAMSNCSECEYFNNYIINDYAQENIDNMKKMYCFDFANIEKSKRDEIKKTYGLMGETTWAYLGALPSIHYIEPNSEHSKSTSTVQAYMFGNDIIDTTNNSIKQSFYNQNRIDKITYANIECSIGKNFSANQIRLDEGYSTLKNEINDLMYRQTAFRFFDHLKEKLS